MRSTIVISCYHFLVRAFLVSTLVLFALAAFAGKKSAPGMMLKPDQNADLPELKLATSTQRCLNWAWAAGLETLLRAQNVNLTQDFWVTRADGGEVCVDDFAGFGAIAKAVDGDFTLQDGRKVRLKVEWQPGAPSDVDPVIARLRTGVPSLLVWRGHAYVLTGATYDEYIQVNGQRMFEIKEIRLADPWYPSGEKHAEKFVRDKDDPAEIDGIMEISVTPRTF